MNYKKNGFTLIELLAVIIILTILSLIATPVIINVIQEAKDKATLDTLYGVVDAGRLYCANAMVEEENRANIGNFSNIYNIVPMQGEIPADGELYLNDRCNSALKVIYKDKCYIKHFYDNLSVSKNLDNCNLGYIGDDTEAPTVSFSVLDGTFNSNGWAKNNFNVNITINDTLSGGNSYKYCIDTKDCEPTALVNNRTGFSEINTESETNKVCVIGIDNYGNESSVICSDNYKLDKTNPTIAVNNISINKNTTLDLNSDVTTNDNLSGVDNYTYNPTSIDISVAGDKTVTYTVIDKAGNSTSIDRTITVITDKPSIAYSTLTSPNSNDWFNSDFYIKAIVSLDSTTSIDNIKWCSSTSDCIPTSTLESDNATAYITSNSATNKMCVQATDKTGNTSDVICSSNYKLDKIQPIAATANISGTLGSNNWYTSNVTITPTGGSDSLSGIASSSVNINSITTNTSETNIIVTTSDLAGNIATQNYTVKVDKNAPSITATSDSINITKGSSNLISSYFTTSYSISSGSISCSPTNTNTLAAGNQVVSCTATGGNGLTSTASKTITVTTVPKLYYSMRDTSTGKYAIIIKDINNGGDTILVNNLTTNPSITSNSSYFYYNDGGAIYKCNTDGSNCSRIYNFGYEPKLAVNENNLYYSMYDTGLGTYAILRCPSTGGGSCDIIITGIYYASGISVTNSNLYYSTYNGTSSKIVKCDLNGQNCGNIVSVSGSSPVATNSSTYFYSIQGTVSGNIYYYAISSSITDGTPVSSGLPSQPTMAASDNAFFYTSYNSGMTKVYKCSKTGTSCSQYLNLLGSIANLSTN